MAELQLNDLKKRNQMLLRELNEQKSRNEALTVQFQKVQQEKEELQRINLAQPRQLQNSQEIKLLEDKIQLLKEDNQRLNQYIKDSDKQRNERDQKQNLQFQQQIQGITQQNNELQAKLENLQYLMKEQKKGQSLAEDQLKIKQLSAENQQFLEKMKELQLIISNQEKNVVSMEQNYENEIDKGQKAQNQMVQQKNQQIFKQEQAILEQKQQISKQKLLIKELNETLKLHQSEIQFVKGENQNEIKSLQEKVATLHQRHEESSRDFEKENRKQLLSEAQIKNIEQKLLVRDQELTTQLKIKDNKIKELQGIIESKQKFSSIQNSNQKVVYLTQEIDKLRELVALRDSEIEKIVNQNQSSLQEFKNFIEGQKNNFDDLLDQSLKRNSDLYETQINFLQLQKNQEVESLQNKIENLTQQIQLLKQSTNSK